MLLNKTKIEWCDVTWNPVTGCLHGCEYCYARRIAIRFGGASETPNNENGNECQWVTEADGGKHILDNPVFDYDRGHKAPFPFGFDPTLHRYRLGEPQRVRKPQTIFVCSMADLLREWVTDEWIEEVFAACVKAPQHRYLFLTKNPGRYLELAQAGKLPEKNNFWYGSSVPTPETPFWFSDRHNTFVSIEPMMGAFPSLEGGKIKTDWIIMGAMTGPGSKNNKPKFEWIESITKDARASGVPIFMKDSMRPFVRVDGMVRDFPWDAKLLNNFLF